MLQDSQAQAFGCGVLYSLEIQTVRTTLPRKCWVFLVVLCLQEWINKGGFPHLGKGGLLNPPSLDLKILERVITDSGLASAGEPGRRGQRGTANPRVGPHPCLQLFAQACVSNVFTRKHKIHRKEDVQKSISSGHG